MSDTIGKHYRALEKMVSQFTRDHEIQPTRGGHISITLHRNGKHRTVFSPQTPGDHRSMLCVKSKVRRAFNEMAA